MPLFSSLFLSLHGWCKKTAVPFYKSPACLFKMSQTYLRDNMLIQIKNKKGSICGKDTRSNHPNLPLKRKEKEMAAWGRSTVAGYLPNCTRPWVQSPPSQRHKQILKTKPKKWQLSKYKKYLSWNLKSSFQVWKSLSVSRNTNNKNTRQFPKQGVFYYLCTCYLCTPSGTVNDVTTICCTASWEEDGVLLSVTQTKRNCTIHVESIDFGRIPQLLKKSCVFRVMNTT